MSRSTMTGLIAGGAALVLVVAAGLWWIFGGPATTTVTAQFSRAVGVYPGSDVRVLGVRVGQVKSVTPRGELVDVVLTIDGDVQVPADAKAAVVAPSVVADRYVQFAGGTRGGARLADGAVIPTARTAVPVELDELYANLDDLLSALGPEGANSDGALSDLLDTGAENLDGHGQTFNESVHHLAELSRTLAEPDEDLFATVDQLQQFTSMLAGNDRQVASANQQLAQLTRTLAADRDELAAALAALGVALADIQDFVRDNRTALQSNVDKLAAITQQLANHRASLAEALDVAPLATSNVLSSFDPASETLQGRVNLLEYLVPTPLAAAAQPAVPLPLVPGGR
jgi:phospholipid/cholesterol/gamma-HCH transport system substrate-binding protein